MSKHLIFVYGTLRRGGGARPMSVRFPDARFVADAKVSGSLYDLGAYPGLILNEAGSSVVGEVYEVDDEILSELDDFEASSNYRRKQVVIPLDGRGRECWTYEPDPEFYSPRALITSGDWVEYDGARKDSPEGTRPDGNRS